MTSDARDEVTRCVVVHWPDWPTVAAGALPGQAAAVLHANRVVAATPSARAEGVVPGLRRREAQRLCPGAVLLPHDPERDARMFDPVLRALEQTTPLLEVGSPGRCTFATRGPSRYYGGDDALVDRVIDHVRSALGPDVLLIAGSPSVGLADGAFAAGLAASYADGAFAAGRVTVDRAPSPGLASRASPPGLIPRSRSSGVVVPPGLSAAFLAPFPTTVFAGHDGIDARFLSLLPQFGVRTLGQIAALPRADIAARFGPVGLVVHRLASGLEARPPLARQPPPDMSVSCPFETPVPTTGPVAFAAKQLADEMFERLRARGLACSQILVTAQTDHGEQHERLWRHEPAFQPVTVAERVRWQLDGWALAGMNAPTAGITLLRIAPTEVFPATGQQVGFWGGRSNADDRALRGIARLVGQLGAEAVHVPEWRGGRNPSEAIALVPAASTDLIDRDVGMPAASGGSSGVSALLPRGGPWPGVLPPPSPATLWKEPKPVQVRDAVGDAVRVTGRGFVSAPPVMVLRGGYTPCRVVAWGGPWPVEEHWWDPQRYRRCARFHLLLEDGSAHLAVIEQGAWRLEATYD